MRRVGEIDVTRPRWSKRPAMLVPLILGSVRTFGPSTAERRLEQGRQRPLRPEQDVLCRLRALPDGERKADQTKRMIGRVRAFAGYRERPKYGIVCRYFLYKQCRWRRPGGSIGTVRSPSGRTSSTAFQELEDVVRSRRADDRLIARRKEEFRSYGALTPPRVLTSDGEAVTGSDRRDDIPEEASAGLAVSTGSVEGRARVVLDLVDAELEEGDILDTRFTEPSWSGPTAMTGQRVAPGSGAGASRRSPPGPSGGRAWP